MVLSDTFIYKMNEWGKNKIPFLFILDFNLNAPLVFPMHDIPSYIWFNIRGVKKESTYNTIVNSEFTFDKLPISMEKYTNSFHLVQSYLHRGDSYLLNLTFPTEIETNLTLGEIYQRCHSPYKLFIDDKFVCFSPETFVTIRDGIISSFPMKGTIDASVFNAKEQILNDPKELAEHSTIVDLIRNDLSKVSNHVKVSRFRYIDKIKTNEGEILQVSSEISGTLDSDYSSRIGTILNEMLPAGSITGAPKEKTVQIIKEAELIPRGLYTGIFGYFDGKNLDSAVMIRCIEKKSQKLYFYSGGGITAQSRLVDEYQELIQKVYVPIN
ncbi:MAG: aminodeoxychorismate synthase component I [Bacteroidota bacterium]|nr:aminodeoxychorismate synthase component I [Bacteroidota bacterium]